MLFVQSGTGTFPRALAESPSQSTLGLMSQRAARLLGSTMTRLSDGRHRHALKQDRVIKIADIDHSYCSPGPNPRDGRRAQGEIYDVPTRRPSGPLDTFALYCSIRFGNGLDRFGDWNNVVQRAA
jgi:hypothetical protein